MTMIEERRAVVQPLVEAAADWMVVTPEEIWSAKRSAAPALARHAIWAVLRSRGWAQQAIGELWHRDHSTVWHGVTRIDKLLAAGDRDVERLMFELKYADEAAGERKRTVLPPRVEDTPRWAQPVIA